MRRMKMMGREISEPYEGILTEENSEEQIELPLDELKNEYAN